METTLAKREILDAIDSVEEGILEQFRFQRETAPGYWNPWAPHVQVLRDKVDISEQFLMRTQKLLSDYKDEEWSRDMQDKVNKLRQKTKPLLDELKTSQDLNKTEEKITEHRRQVSEVYGEVGGDRVSLLGMARFYYEIWNGVSIALFLLALYLKLWSHGIIDAPGEAS